MERKRSVVIHSGGMDSSICLAQAVKNHGNKAVHAISFDFSQRHSKELAQAKKIATHFGVSHEVLDLRVLAKITTNSLLNREQKHDQDTLVVGRNGLMARLGAIYANKLYASEIVLGILEQEEWMSGYRDCSRAYMDKMEEILRIDLGTEEFFIRTPLVSLSKVETLELAKRLGCLPYLLKETVTCYQGIMREGCMECAACRLRNKGLFLFRKKYPLFPLPYEPKCLESLSAAASA